MPVALLYVLYALGAGIGFGLFLFGRRFKTVLRSLFQSFGGCLVTLTLAFMVFAPNLHEFEVVVIDFSGAIIMFGAPGAVLGALWATRHSGCLALVVSGLLGLVLDGLGLLTLNSGLMIVLDVLSKSQNPFGEWFQRVASTGLIFLGLLAVLVIPWTVIGFVQENKVVQAQSKNAMASDHASNDLKTGGL